MKINKRTKKMNKFIIKEMGPKHFDNEVTIYNKRLSYTPKLVSKDKGKGTIKIDFIEGKTLSKIPEKDRKKYYPQLRKLFNQFKKDTGYYHGDFVPKNIIVDNNENIYLIDFEIISKNKKGLIDNLAPKTIKRRWDLLKKIGIKEPK